MRLRFNQQGLVWFLAAVTFPDTTIRICATVQFPDGTRTRKEVLPDEVHPTLRPIAAGMLLLKIKAVTDRDFLEKMNEYIASDEFKTVQKQEGWSEINLGPWIKKTPTPSLN